MIGPIAMIGFLAGLVLVMVGLKFSNPILMALGIFISPLGLAWEDVDASKPVEPPV